MKPQFQIGDEGEIEGVEWRIMQGAKSRDDIVLQIRATEWVKPKMALSFFLADFHDQSESRLVKDGYVRAIAGSSGQFFLNQVRNAVQAGWKWPADKLESQRENRRAA